MKEVVSEKDCTACYACQNKCPKHCIEVKKGKNDTLYAQIEEKECIDCKNCIKVCPIQNPVMLNEPIKVYAAWSKNDEIRRTSSSGGIAAQLYRSCIRKNWLVVGTKFDSEFNLNYVLTDSMEEVEQFKGSKYVQSQVNNIYSKVKENLENGRNILFIGLPCHIAGLKNYLNKDYDNLLTVDLVCHGVSPSGYLKEHIKYLETQLKQKIERITFREENEYALRAYTGNKKIYDKKGSLDFYYRGFLVGLFYRESCYNCKYANAKRVSDITLGDFWGLGSEVPFHESTKDGVSLMLINTTKGEAILESMKEEFFLCQRTIEEAIKQNKQLQSPSKRDKNYTRFKKYKQKYNFEQTAKKILAKDIGVLKAKLAIKRMIKR